MDRADHQDSTTFLSARDLQVDYGTTKALRGASVEIRRGEIVAITGASGSGKSTLLYCLAGLIVPDAGEVIFRDVRLSEASDEVRSRVRRESFGFVLQFGQLVSELTAGENVALPLRLLGRPRKHAVEAANEALDRLGVAELRQRLPGQLSGGQQQRIAVARALVTRPSVVFADEPTGALDSENSHRVLAELVDLARAEGSAVVLVTHDPAVAAAADREVCIRDGRVLTP